MSDLRIIQVLPLDITPTVLLTGSAEAVRAAQQHRGEAVVIVPNDPAALLDAFETACADHYEAAPVILEDVRAWLRTMLPSGEPA